MRRKKKTSSVCCATDILRNNEGTSLVLVSIIAIIILTGVVILRMTTNALWASADKQYFQDQAYESATSLGESLNSLIVSGQIPLNEYNYDSRNTATLIDGLPRGCSATVTKAIDVYTVIVVSEVGNAEYEYRATYLASNSSSGTRFTRQY